MATRVLHRVRGRDAAGLLAVASIALLLVALPLAAGLPEAIERVKPSVVAVGTYQKTRSPSFAFRGSGFAVGDGTLIATNAHVVPEVLQTEARETLMVLTHVPGAKDPQPREAQLLALDRDHDLALLRISGAPLPAVTIGSGEGVNDGRSVAFTGFPIGNALGFYPVTHRAIIAARTPVAIPGPSSKQLDARMIKSLKAGPFVLYQLDASAYPGHSGSPLYDADTGEVIGVINMGYVKGTKDAATGQPTGISWAVPATFLQDLIRNAR